MVDYKSLYGMDVDQYLALEQEARSANPDIFGRMAYMQPQGGIADGGMPGANIAMWNAIKANDKRLTGADGDFASRPEIDGILVRGPYTHEMAGSKNGQWMYAGRTPDQYGAVRGSGDDAPTSNYRPGEEQWIFRENKQPEIQQVQPEQMPDDPKPQGPTIYDSWDDYINIARAETEGMNRMPFVGPNWQKGNPTYADIPYNPDFSLEMFYPGAQNEWRKDLRDPLKGEGFKPIVK